MRNGFVVAGPGGRFHMARPGTVYSNLVWGRLARSCHDRPAPFPSRSCGEYGFAGLAEGVEGGLCDVPGVEAGGVVHGGWAVLVLEAVGQVHGAELEPVLDAVVAHQRVEHGRPEPAVAADR